MPRLLYYVSGHGYGHARRSAEVIRAVLERSPASEVTVRTAASPHLFHPLPASRIERSAIDAGMAEDGPLKIDGRATLDRLVKLCGDADRLVSEELTAVRRLRPDLILADVPFLAGDVAAAAAVPCFAVSNFTWDWICDPLLAGEPQYAAVRDRMRSDYEKMTACLRLPLGGVSDVFGRVIDMPLIASRSGRDPLDTLRALGVPPDDDRPNVLVGLRGGLPEAVLRAAATGAPDYLFLLPPDSSVPDPPSNLLPVPAGAGVTFGDLVNATDVVFSKLGYGIVSDCIAGNKRLLWPRRTGFREDEVVEREGPRYLRMRELTGPNFSSGHWRGALDALMAASEPQERLATDGAGGVAITLDTFLR